MKTITILLLSTLLCGEAAYAQQTRWAIDVSGGISLPVGAFGRKVITDSTSGFAKIGPVVNLSGSYRITRYFGVTALVSIQKNAVDNKAIASTLHAVDPDYFFVSDEPDWKVGRVLGGAYLRYPLDHKKRMEVVIKGMAGVLKVDFPARKLAQIQESNGGFNEDEGEVSYTIKKLQFAYQAGAEFHYALTRRFFLKAEADYAGATIHVPQTPFVFASKSAPGVPPFSITTGTGPTTPPTGIQVNYTQPLATINFCLGVGVRF